MKQQYHPAEVQGPTGLPQVTLPPRSNAKVQREDATYLRSSKRLRLQLLFQFRDVTQIVFADSREVFMCIHKVLVRVFADMVSVIPMMGISGDTGKEIFLTEIAKLDLGVKHLRLPDDKWSLADGNGINAEFSIGESITLTV